MTDESVNYDIQQVQNDIERLQRDLARLQNDAASSTTPSRYEPAVLYDPLHAEKEITHALVMPKLVVCENQSWSTTSIPTTAMIDEEYIYEFIQAQQKLSTSVPEFAVTYM